MSRQDATGDPFGIGSALRASSLTGSAFAGALLASIAVFVLARSSGKVTSTRLLLAGVAVGYLLWATTSFLIIASDSPEGARSVLFWLLDSLSLATQIGAVFLIWTDVEERDLQRPRAHSVVLAHQLVQAPVPERAVSLLVDVHAV